MELWDKSIDGKLHNKNYSTSINTAGRIDLEDLFSKSDLLTSHKLTHTPFLVFTTLPQSVTVNIVKNVTELLTFDDSTKVMVQWAGQWRSDFFQFQVKDVRDYLKRKSK